MYVLLQDVFNFDEFIEKFTEEEQCKLMKLLPGADSVDLPDRFQLNATYSVYRFVSAASSSSYTFCFFFPFTSLRSMFECSQFKDNFSLFQQLVAYGVFETLSSSSSSKPEEFKKLAKLALSDPNKSHLLESYCMLKVFDIYSS